MSGSWVHRIAVGVVLPLGSFSAASTSAAASFTGLGDLPGGAFQSIARDVSADGMIVVGSSSSAAGNRAFRWTLAGGMEDLGPGEANAVTPDGSVVVGGTWLDTGHFGLGPGEAFRWTSAGGVQLLGDLTGGHRSVALDVSADGSIVVGASASNATGEFIDVDTGELVIWNADYEAFRWAAPGGMQGLGLVAPDQIYDEYLSFASGISADGTLIVGGGSIGAYEGDAGMYWPGNDGLHFVQFDCCEEVFLGVSPDGSTLTGGTWPGGGGRGYIAKRLPDGSVVAVGHSPFSDEENIWDASLYGEVLVGSSEEGDSLPFIMVNGGDDSYVLQDFISDQLGLDITGWDLTEVKAVSWDGNTIVGTGINPSGEKEAWLLVIPEPNVASLLLSGLGAIAWSRRERPRSG